MFLSLELLRALSQTIGWTILHSLWQGTAIAALATLLLYGLRRRPPALHHAVCLLAIGLCAGCAVVTAGQLWRPVMKQAVPPAPGAVATLAAPVPDAAAAPSLASAELVREYWAAPDESSAVAPASLSWWVETMLPWLSLAWGLGVAGLVLRQSCGWWRLRQWQRGSAPVPMAITETCRRLLEGRATVRVLASANAAVPMLAGLVRPVILLPWRVMSGLPAAELEAILAHECAHLLRRDLWTNFLLLTAETLFFYHPALWWLGQRSREAREQAADDLALTLCEDRHTYVRALAHLAELPAGPPAALAATSGNLLRRIRRIVQPAAPEPVAVGWGYAGPALVALIMAMAWLPAQAQEGKPIEVAVGASIQTAIDAAPEGATIRLPAGTWNERLVIAKPLTLEGAGWEQTRLAVEDPPAEELAEASRDIVARYKTAKTDEERLRLGEEYTRRVYQPAIWVRDAQHVTLRKLRVQGVAGRPNSPSCLVVFRRAVASMEECAVVGPYASGVIVGTECKVEIARSLVAALWSDGVLVAGATETPEARGAGQLHLVESEVRNVYHYGVKIGPKSDQTVVERCRISGTAWHGIRYDYASPTITGNVIFGNARMGIYANGATRATVRGNVFWRNEMSGFSGWTANQDLVEGNTFVGNLREHLAVLGAKSRPEIRRNIFAKAPTAVACSRISGEDGSSAPTDGLVLEQNLFWENKVAFQYLGEERQAPEGSVLAAPQFRNAAGQDFALTDGASAQIGVAMPLAPSGPWPLLAEEKAMIPDGDTREFNQWKGREGTPTKPAAAAASTEKPELEVEWRGRWWPARVLQREGERTQIHYVGFGAEWDEWVTTKRMRPVAGMEVKLPHVLALTTKAKKEFRAGDALEIREVMGSLPTLQVGGTYRVVGNCRQLALAHASLYVGNTAEAGSEAIKAVAWSSLYQPLPQGETAFDVTFTLLRPGTLHVTVYNLDNHDPKDNAYAGVYLGEVGR